MIAKQNTTVEQQQTKSLSKSIQARQFDLSMSPDAANWRTTFIFAQLTGKWLRIYFNHIMLNGTDAVNLFSKNKHRLEEAIRLNSLESGPMVLLEGGCWVEMEGEELKGNTKYIGSAHVKAKDVIRDFNDVFQGVFYIPIDMSHSFGEPTLLNYSFKDITKFDENWDEVRRIKKNENNYLEIDNKWERHLEPQIAWVTIIAVKNEEQPVVMRQYDYDRDSLQGLGIVVTKLESYWTFSFFAKPEQKDFFISKYNLVPLIR